MSNARKIADLLDSDGDVISTALDNVPASNNASALTTGTLPDGRFPATLPAVSGASLTNLPGGGKVLQVQHVTDTAFSILGSSSHTLMSLSVTPISSNSSFILICTVTHGIPQLSNNDSYDIGFQFTREYSGSSQTSIGGNPSATRREAVSGGGTLYTTDVPIHVTYTTYNAKYETFTRSFNHKDSPSVSSGTAITYKLMVKAQTSYWRNRAEAGGSSGGQSSLIVMEVAE